MTIITLWKITMKREYDETELIIFEIITRCLCDN